MPVRSMSFALPRELRSCQRGTEAGTSSCSASRTLVGESASSSDALERSWCAPMRRGCATAPRPSSPSSTASIDAAVRATLARQRLLIGPSEAARGAGSGSVHMRAGSDERRSVRKAGGATGLDMLEAADALTENEAGALGLVKNDFAAGTGVRRSSVERRGRHLLSIDGAWRQGGNVVPAQQMASSAMTTRFDTMATRFAADTTQRRLHRTLGSDLIICPQAQ